MSTTWANIFTTNNSPHFDIHNYNYINNWYRDIKHSLTPEHNIDHNRLTPNHPLTRPIELTELKHSLNKHRNTKAPGPSGIKAIQIKKPSTKHHTIHKRHI